MKSALNEAMIYLRKPIEDVVIPTFIKRAEAYVNVCHIISPSEFFIRLEANTPFVNELNKIPRENLEKSICADIGSLVLYASNKEGGKLLRGIVIRKENLGQTYVIEAIDIGFKDYDITQENIWDCDIKFPPLAYSCQLDACKPVNGDIWQDFCIDGFKSLVKGSLKMVYVTTIGHQLVVQIHIANQMASELMIMCGWAMMKPSQY